jgi:hypothetical protein
MTVESPGPYAGGPRDLVEAGPRPFLGKSGLRGFEQADAVALRIGARLADGCCLPLVDHAENTP